MVALVTDPNGTADIKQVSIEVAGSPSGAFLYDDGSHGDITPGDGFFMQVIPGLQPGIPQMRTILELVASDFTNESSLTWPYLDVK